MISKPFIKSKNVFTVKDEVGPTKIIRSHKKPLEMVDESYYNTWCGHTQTVRNQDITPPWMITSSASTVSYGCYSGYSNYSSNYIFDNFLGGTSGIMGTSGVSGTSGPVGTSGVSGTSGFRYNFSIPVTSNPSITIQLPPNSIMKELGPHNLTIPVKTKKWWQIWKKEQKTLVGSVPPEEIGNKIN